MGSTQLNSQEIASVKKLQQEERKKLLENEKKKSDIENGLKDFTNNLYLQKSVIGLVNVTKNDQEVQETEQEKRHRIFLENIELYKKKESFMMEKFLDLRPLNYEEDIHLKSKGTNKYLGGMVKKDKSYVRQGRGVLYDGKYYYAGYWDNNEPNGFFFKYYKDKVINFQGFLLRDYNIDTFKKGKAFFRNGERYEGYFYKSEKHGFGTYYFSNGNSFTGTFNLGQFDGTGKYFYDNGLISEIITYQNNKIVSKYQK
jgi:hypothetical protein